MKTVVRAFLLNVLALGLTLAAGEKGNKGEGGKGGMMKRTPEIDFILDHAKDLSLTGEQKKKINDVKDKMENQREKNMKDPENRELMKEVMAAKKSGDEEKLRQLQLKVREKMNKNGGEDLMSEVLKALQPEQLAKLKELRESEGGPRGGKMAGGKGGAGGKTPEGQKPDPKKGVPSLFDNEK